MTRILRSVARMSRAELWTRATERAVCGLREAILGGEFASWVRLGEVELAERLGVSRTPFPYPPPARGWGLGEADP